MGNSSIGSAGRGLGLLGLGVTLGTALVASTALLGSSLRDIKSDGQTIEVKGYAERPILSDHASWQGSFTTRAATLEAAYEKLAEQQVRVRAFAALRGFAPGEIGFSPVSTQVLYARDEKGIFTNEIEGYALSLSLRVESGDIDRVGALADDSGALVKQGIELSAGAPEYVYTKQGELKIEMLAEATADARRRAEVLAENSLAENSKARIGGLRSARQGVFQITPAHSTEISDYGRNDTTTREKSIKAVVTIVYALES
jgi:hypothetical protein